MPSQLLAQPNQKDQASKSQSPQIEAAIIPLPLGGPNDFIAIAPIAESQQAEVLNHVLNHAPETTVIGIADTADSALSDIAQHPNLSHTHIAVNDQPETMAALDELPRSLRARVVDKIRKLRANIRSRTGLEKAGLLLSISGTAVAAGATFYASGSYISAGGLLGVLYAITAYRFFYQSQWNIVKNYGRESMIGLASFIAGKIGRELSHSQKQKLGLSGEFHVAWLSNAVVGAVLMLMTTSVSDWSLQLPLQALVAGFISNPDVWDHSVRRYEENRLVTQRFTKSFIMFRMGIMALLELLTNLQMVQGHDLITGFITMSGIVWFLAGDTVERQVANKLSRVKERRAKWDRRLKCRALLQKGFS